MADNLETSQIVVQDEQGNNQLVQAVANMSGDIVWSKGIEDAWCVVQDGQGNKQLALKTAVIAGGGGGGGSTNIVTLTTESTQLATNTIYNGGELASVTLTLPNSVPVDFIAQVEFTSGATATTFSAPETLYFNGDACEGGVFTPTASKRYCILIISDGVNVLGFVYEK